MSIAREAVNLDIFKIIVKCLTASDGYIEIEKLKEFVFSCKKWWTSLLPHVKEIALRQGMILKISSALLARSLKMAHVFIHREGEDKDTPYKMLTRLFYVLRVRFHSPDLVVQNTDARICPFISTGSICKRGETKTGWEVHYMCLFKLLLAYQRLGKLTFESKWKVPYSALGLFMEDTETGTDREVKDIKDSVIVSDIALCKLSIFEGFRLDDGKAFYNRKCPVNPGSIFRWMNAMWDGLVIPAFLEDLRKELESNENKFKVTTMVVTK
jgi:hypothetical protein